MAARFTGVIEQVPPIFSAIKRGGVALYRLARRGDEVEPPQSRRVEIRQLSLAAEGADSIRFTALCSPGTYARSLARDIGAALGSAGCLYELRRLRNGEFRIGDALALDRVLAALEADGGKSIPVIGLREALGQMPEVTIDASLEARLRHGDSRVLDGLVPAGAPLFKVVSMKPALVAVARATSRVTAVIERVFVS